MKDLWPDSIQADTQSPKAILKFQADKLRFRTKSRVEARLRTSDVPDVKGEFQTTFEICTPDFGWVNAILKIHGNTEIAYPVKVISNYHPTPKVVMGVPLNPLAEMVSPKPNQPIRRLDAHTIEVDSDEAFERVLSAVFSSPRVVQAIQSLVVRFNDARGADATTVTPPPGPTQ